MRTLLLLVTSLLLATPAIAQEDAEPAMLIGKDFRQAIAGLDRADPAVGYAFAARREGIGLIAGGGGLVGLSLVLAAVDTIGPLGGSSSPYIAGTGIPLGLVVVIAGVPGLLGSQRYFAHLLERPTPSTRLGRLRMMRDWRVYHLRLRRDAGLIGSAFLGGIAILSGVVWAARDAIGANTTSAGGYDYADLHTTFMFTGAGGISALLGLLGHLEYTQETKTPHRLYAASWDVGVAPLVSPDGGRGIAAVLTVGF